VLLQRPGLVLRLGRRRERRRGTNPLLLRGLLGELVVAAQVQRPGHTEHEHHHGGRGHRRVGDERPDEALEPALPIGVRRLGQLGRAPGGFLQEQRRDRLWGIELDLEDPTLSDRVASQGQVGQRGPIRRMRIEVRLQPRLFGGRELAVEGADQQRIEVLTVDHGSWVLILRVYATGDDTNEP
jgi:hypothetical protein